MLRRPRSARGATIIEVAVTSALMSTVVVGLVAAIQSTMVATDVTQKTVGADAVATSWAERVKSPAAAYVPCATTSSYAPAAVGATVPERYTARVVAVELLTVPTGTQTTGAFGPVPADCAASSDPGVTRLTLEVATSDNRASRRVLVVKRRP